MQEQSSPGQDADAITRELFQHAQERAQSKGYQLGPGAGSDLRGVAERVGREIAGELLSAQEEQIRRAKQAFEKLIDTMIDVRDEVDGPDRQDNIIGEQTVGGARQILCPLWPIC